MSVVYRRRKLRLERSLGPMYLNMYSICCWLHGSFNEVLPSHMALQNAYLFTRAKNSRDMSINRIELLADGDRYSLRVALVASHSKNAHIQSSFYQTGVTRLPFYSSNFKMPYFSLNLFAANFSQTCHNVQLPKKSFGECCVEYTRQ